VITCHRCEKEASSGWVEVEAGGGRHTGNYPIGTVEHPFIFTVFDFLMDYSFHRFLNSTISTIRLIAAPPTIRYNSIPRFGIPSFPVFEGGVSLVIILKSAVTWSLKIKDIFVNEFAKTPSCL
jgi:hypothetical protein